MTALDARVWYRDALGICGDCGHYSNWHYAPGHACMFDHVACGCREFKGKIRRRRDDLRVLELLILGFQLDRLAGRPLQELHL